MTLENIVHKQYIPLLKANEATREKFRFGRALMCHNNGFNKEMTFHFLPETLIDKRTMKLIQIDDLFNSVNYTVTATGSAVLYRSLIQPPTSLDLINAKQEALRELESNNVLRKSLESYIDKYSKGEGSLFYFLNDKIDQRFPYSDYKRAIKAAKNIFKDAKDIPETKSRYLDVLLDDINSLGNSSIYDLVEGPIYRTFKGIKSEEEKKWYMPSWIFRPTRLSVGSALMSMPFLGVTAAMSNGYLERGQEAAQLGAFSMTGILAAFFYSAFIKPMMDESTVMQPLRKKAIEDRNFNLAIEAVGKIDELLSFHRFSKDSGHETCLPKMKDNESHHFIAEKLRNPIQGKENPDFVPNNIYMNGENLTFITGPNSGGKTTICKTIVQNQMLAQIGSYIMASRGSINVTDMIAYQAPMFDALQDDEGRFGTEMSITRDIFYRTTPKSLVVLDELSEGTTYEEKIVQSYSIMDDFNTIGNNTVLVSHNHELVDVFRKEGKGQFKMVEFDGTDPTHKIINGISKESHAMRVAEKIGFSPQDRKDYLAKNGYIN